MCVGGGTIRLLFRLRGGLSDRTREGDGYGREHSAPHASSSQGHNGPDSASSPRDQGASGQASSSAAAPTRPTDPAGLLALADRSQESAQSLNLLSSAPSQVLHSTFSQPGGSLTFQPTAHPTEQQGRPTGGRPQLRLLPHWPPRPPASIPLEPRPWQVCITLTITSRQSGAHTGASASGPSGLLRSTNPYLPHSPPLCSPPTIPA